MPLHAKPPCGRAPRSAAHRAAVAALTALAAAAGACRTYEPQPFDPAAALRALEAVSLASATEGGRDDALEPRDGLTAREAAAVAVRLNPELRAARARVGVARAALVEAGLLPDVEIGWDAGDVIADAIVEGSIADASYVAGASLMWRVPRPGEIDAKEQAARADIDGARAAALARELDVVRDAHLAHLDLLAAKARLELNLAVTAIARGTHDYFETARSVGAATALQAALARIALSDARLEAVRLEGEEAQARQALNAILGLPPTIALEPQGALPGPDAPEVPPLPALMAIALERRPDLAALRATYERAEAELRLEVVRQWPDIAIGTGIAITLPIFSGWNGPAIDTALAKREAARRDLEARVHEIRRDVHAARALAARALAEVRFFAREVQPSVEAAVRLSGEAFEAKEATLFEVLTAQSQVTQARARLLDARARYGEARVRLDAATGALLPAPSGGRSAARPDEEEPKR